MRFLRRHSKQISTILFNVDMLYKTDVFKFSLQLTDNSWFQIHKHGTRYMFTGACLTEEGVEGVVTAADGFITWHLTIRLDAMLQTVQLPAGVANLDTGLTGVDTDTFTLETDAEI